MFLARFTVRDFRDKAGNCCLPRTAGTREKVGVGDSILAGGFLQNSHDDFVTDEVGENRRSVFAIEGEHGVRIKDFLI